MDILNYRMMGITLQQMQLFCLAAECENLTETARRVHMTQASVSRNIAALENNLGIALFHRQKKRIYLTKAGVQLAKDWRRVLVMAANSAEQAAKLQEGPSDSLFLADYYTANSEEYLLPFVRQFESVKPGIKIQVEKTDPITIFNGINERYYDAVFFSVDGEAMLKDAGLQFKKLFSLYPCIVLSSGHRLFNAESVSTSDFAEETIVAMTDDRYKFYLQMVENVCQKSGFPIDNLKYVSNAHTMAFELMRGQCIAIMDEIYAPFVKMPLRYVQLLECGPILGYGIAWSLENDNPCLRDLLDFSKKFKTTFNE